MRVVTNRSIQKFRQNDRSEVGESAWIWQQGSMSQQDRNFAGNTTSNMVHHCGPTHVRVKMQAKVFGRLLVGLVNCIPH